jgi:hypothetical protein
VGISAVSSAIPLQASAQAVVSSLAATEANEVQALAQLASGGQTAGNPASALGSLVNLSV